MKLKYFCIVPLLLISGCSNGESKYVNVNYEFIREKHQYKVEIYGKNYSVIKQWNVKPSDVHYVFYEYYVYDENNNVVYNEFYVKGNNYSLFVYKKQ